MTLGIATDVITENQATDISVCLQLQIYLDLQLYVSKEIIFNCTNRYKWSRCLKFV